MQIRHVNIKVDNQAQALSFYTSVLGFVKKLDIPMGEFRWLTVSSPEGGEGVELVVEPNNFAPAQVSQKALYDAGLPAAVFTTDDVGAEYRRLKGLGVKLHVEPASMGPVTVVFFEGTCGNIINWVQPAARPNDRY